MKLEWMGKYRDVVESLIHYCNIYAAAYRPEKMRFGDTSFSFAQIQVLEYLLENEERQDNMTSIAQRLGITRSNFTKIVNRLVSKGLVEKNYLEGGRKELTVIVTPYGKQLYEAYAQQILRYHFQAMFNALDHIPDELLPYFTEALDNANSKYLRHAAAETK